MRAELTPSENTVDFAVFFRPQPSKLSSAAASSSSVVVVFASVALSPAALFLGRGRVDLRGDNRRRYGWCKRCHVLLQAGMVRRLFHFWCRMFRRCVFGGSGFGFGKMIDRHVIENIGAVSLNVEL